MPALVTEGLAVVNGYLAGPGANLAAASLARADLTKAICDAQTSIEPTSLGADLKPDHCGSRKLQTEPT